MPSNAWMTALMVLIGAAQDENKERDSHPGHEECANSQGREGNTAAAGPHRQGQPADEDSTQREQRSRSADRLQGLRDPRRGGGKGAREGVVLGVGGVSRTAGH